MLKKVIVLGALATSSAHASYDPEDPITLSAGVNYHYDSNVFRVEDASQNTLSNQYGKLGDSVFDVLASMTAQASPGRQKLSWQAGVDQPYYTTFKELNKLGWNSALNWQWVAGDRLSGDLIASTQHQMASYDEQRIDKIDMQRNDNLSWSGLGLIGSNWAVVVDAQFGRERHDENDYLDANTKQAGVGLQYQTGKGTSLTLRQGWSTYDYQTFLLVPADQRGYRERNTTLVLKWPATAKLNLNMQYGYSSWTSNYGGANNRSPVWMFDIAWQPTVKTTLQTGYDQSYADHNNGLGRDLERKYYLRGSWLLTEKLKSRAEASYRTVTTDTAIGVETQDVDYRMLNLALDYQVRRNVLFSSYYRYEIKRDFLFHDGYLDQQVGLSINYLF